MQPIPIEPAATGRDLKECLKNQTGNFFHPDKAPKKIMLDNWRKIISGGIKILPNDFLYISPLISISS
jgi:hypothetical protein